MSPSGAVRQLLMRTLSPAAAAWEYYFKPDLRDPFGGPFNGQHGRQAIFREILELLPVAGIVETGTFRASTTEYMASQTTAPIWTVEVRRRFFYFARMRLARFGNVDLSVGDSRTFLQRLAGDPRVPKRGVFFYLDAHWYEDLPLRDEVATVTRHWSEYVIMVDDFQVPDDPGYQFDDYGEGKRLCLDYLGPLARYGLHAFFPSISSTDESGMRRGSVILADSAATTRLDRAATLQRPALR